MPPAKKSIKTSKESTFRAKVRKQILKKKTPDDELDYEIEAEYEPDGMVEHTEVDDAPDMFELRISAVEKKFLKALEDFKAAQEHEYQKKESAAAAAKAERRTAKKKEQEQLMNERLELQKKEIEREFNEKLKNHRNLSNQLDSLVRKRHNTFNY